jgi:hypothetical protein
MRCDDAQREQLRAAVVRILTVLAAPAVSADDTRAIVYAA